MDQYAQANNGQFPTDLSQLQPYFISPMDDSILQRWKIVPGSTVPSLGMGGTVITQIAAVDADYDSRYSIGLNGWGTAGPDNWDAPGTAPYAVLKPAAEAYAAANNGQEPKDWASQLAPYVTTPEQQAALQRLIKRGKR